MTLCSEAALAVRAADEIVVCLANDEATEAVLLQEALLGALRPGSLVLDCGTTSVELTDRLQRSLAALGVAFLDAPITGSKLGAERTSSPPPACSSPKAETPGCRSQSSVRNP